jgi:hypothetical protein
MAKITLLEMTQNILNDMDSDEVNSIDDTVESQQVANIIKACYREMISNRNWPHLRKLVQFESSGDLSKPNYLLAPAGLKELITISYDKRRVGDTRTRLEEIKYKTPEDFLRFVSARNGDLDNVQEVIDFSGTTLLTFNDVAPSYWTSFDDNYIVTDSYNAALDDTLKKVKNQCLAYIEKPWVHTDDAIPDLPEEAFSALEEEAKSTCFINLKQMANQKAEQKAGRQNRWLARKAWRTAGGVEYENYGRASRK